MVVMWYFEILEKLTSGIKELVWLILFHFVYHLYVPKQLYLNALIFL